jgi:AAA15 family ATPase/GTPase
MNAHAQSFALNAITLRGVGSYLYGQRLDLRPLTIICGENGSGKSTWFKALNLLKNSIHQPAFPFVFTQDADCFWHGYTNSYLSSFPEDCEQDAKADDTSGNW